MIYLINIFRLIRVVFTIFRVPIATFLLIVALILLTIFIIRIWNDKIIRFLCRNRTINSIEFPDDEVVVSPEPLKKTLLPGAVLFVPPNTAAWMAPPPVGNPTPYEQGQHVVRFETRFAHPQYVDIRRRSNDFIVEGASTKDGFVVTFHGRVSWIVRDVGGVVLIKQPVQELLMEINKAVRCVVAKYDHDKLVPTPGKEPMNESELIKEIRDELEEKDIFEVISLLSLILENRVGDSDWIERAKVSKLQELNGQIDSKVLNNRLVSVKKKKEIAAVESDIKEEEIKHERQARQEEWAKEEKRERERQNLEREINLVKARSDALAPVLDSYTKLLSQPNGRASRDDVDVNMLGSAVHSIVQGLGEPVRFILPGEYQDVPNEPPDAKSELYRQLSDAASLEGFTNHNLKETSNGRWRLEVWVCNTRQIFWYNLGGSMPVITDIIVIGPSDAIHRETDPEPYKRLKLKQVIQKLCDRYNPKE